MRERDLFNAALDIEDLTERRAFVDEQCVDDVKLADRLRAMLEYQEGDDEFLCDACLQPHELDLAGIEVGKGATVGRYKLLEEVGEGGFGIVFLAEQTEPLRRKVALKVIKPGMDTRQVIALFETERQSLALMDHPYIARVLDGGTTEQGRPFFVMELVDGIPITQFCDQHQLDTVARLKLFMKVCRAIQHAHQRGIIHRDIKPTNVLVTQDGEEAIPRVIDFGVAKAIGEQPDVDTRFTRQGQLLGTPQYMSPEQANRSVLDVDTRNDVYSLGILLYELLSGYTPLDKERIQSATKDELCRLIGEQETATPSSKISTVGEAVETICRNRDTVPIQLRQLLRHELDWITLKALHKERGLRYESPSALVDDIERFLNGQPVVAGPPGATYRVRKFVRRNRVLVLATSAVAVSLLVGATTTLLTLTELRQTVSDLQTSRDEVETQAQIAKSNFDITVSMLTSVEEDPKVTVLEMLDEFVISDLPLRLKSERPEVRAAHRSLLGRVYSRLGEQHRAQPFFVAAVNDRREKGEQLLLAKALLNSAENSLYCCEYADSHEAAAEAMVLFGDTNSEYARHAGRLSESANTSKQMRDKVVEAMAACRHLESAPKFKERLLANPDFTPAGTLYALLLHLFADVEDFAFAEKICMMHPIRYDLEHRAPTTGKQPALFANVTTAREFSLGLLASYQADLVQSRRHYKAVLEQMRNNPERNEDNKWVEPLYAWAILHQDQPDRLSMAQIAEAERRADLGIDLVIEVGPRVQSDIAAAAYHTKALAKFMQDDLVAAIKYQVQALEEIQNPGGAKRLLFQLVVEEQLASFHFENGDLDTAKQVADNAIKWRRDTLLDEDHPNLRSAIRKLAWLLE